MRWLAVVVLIGCAEPPPAPPPEVVPGVIAPGGTPVEQVDGTPITQEMVDTVVDRLPPEDKARAQADPDQVVDVLVTTQLLYAAALQARVQDDPGVQLAMAMAQRDVLAGAMADRIGREAFTEETVAALYEARHDRYARPQVKARHIVVADATVAKDLRARLDAGEDFAALAKQYSQETDTAALGGELGWFEREEMFHQVADAAFAAEPGALLGPIETRLGYHLVLVEDKRDAVPLDDARPELEAEIRSTALSRWIETARAGATIEAAPAATP